MLAFKPIFSGQGDSAETATVQYIPDGLAAPVLGFRRCILIVSIGWRMLVAHAGGAAGNTTVCALARDITERPHAPSGVAVFMSAHSKTPYITP